MKHLIHLSDLHFGTERDGLVEALIADIHKLDPELIVISGDLTQRAFASQYRAAKRFLDILRPYPILCVPGNHDISLHNPFERFLYPYQKYRHYIHPILCPHFYESNIAIVGINSVTPYKTMSGFVTDEQLSYVENFFNKHNDKKIKIVVMHHNLIRSERHKIINDADKIIAAFAASNVNIVLSGHIHATHVELLKKNYLHHNMYIVTAGTAISYRTTEPNSYNLLTLGDNLFTITVREYQKDGFINAGEHSYPL